MQCPECGLENPPTTIRCDCGYNFNTGVKGAPALENPEPAHISGTNIFQNNSQSFGCLFVFMIAVFLAIVYISYDSEEEIKQDNHSAKSTNEYSTNEQYGEWTFACGNIWVGVKLYYGSSKMYVGDVICGSNNAVNPITGETFRGVKVKMPSGSIELKDRNDIAVGKWYVKKNDPAIARMEWRECD